MKALSLTISILTLATATQSVNATSSDNPMSKAQIEERIKGGDPSFYPKVLKSNSNTSQSATSANPTSPSQPSDSLSTEEVLGCHPGSADLWQRYACIDCTKECKKFRDTNGKTENEILSCVKACRTVVKPTNDTTPTNNTCNDHCKNGPAWCFNACHACKRTCDKVSEMAYKSPDLYGPSHLYSAAQQRCKAACGNILSN